MQKSNVSVVHNKFAISSLKKIAQRTVYQYRYKFDSPPKLGKQYMTVNRILRQIGTPGTRWEDRIITKKPIVSSRLQNNGWELESLGTTTLNLERFKERNVLRDLEKRHLMRALEKIEPTIYKVERSGGKIIWLNTSKVVLQNLGWKLFFGFSLDLEIGREGELLIEIDPHHRFNSIWTLSRWREAYGDLPVRWVRNSYDNSVWRLVRVSNEKPEEIKLDGRSDTLADYHRNLKYNKATEEDICNALVVYVMNNDGKVLPHIDTRLIPSIDFEITSYLDKQGNLENARITSKTHIETRKRFEDSIKTVSYLNQKIYQQKKRSLTPQKSPHFLILRTQEPVLLAKSGKVNNPAQALKFGCLRTGETKFGFLDLEGKGTWSEIELVKNKLEHAARKSGVEISLDEPKTQKDFPDSYFERKQFWDDYAMRGINTVLLNSKWLGKAIKYKIRQEALGSNVAVQFMQPKPEREKNYQAISVVLQLLIKAGWQPVGLEPLNNPEAAEMIIGFDVGYNGRLHYGTSAFAILANGQSLGWEIPTAQSGETLAGESILTTTFDIIIRFQKVTNRLPRRIMLLRDGFDLYDEFDSTVAELLKNGIEVDVLSIRKSGAGRLAVENKITGNYDSTAPGCASFPKDPDNIFYLVSSEAKAGGSPRPLEIEKVWGNTPLDFLALQIDRMCMLNPASGYAAPRLPYPIHCADKMAKEIGYYNSLNCLQGVNRHKIFFS